MPNILLGEALPPYPLLEVPQYRQGDYGRWQLTRRDHRSSKGSLFSARLFPDLYPDVVRGYFTGFQPIGVNWILSEKKVPTAAEQPSSRKNLVTWMSITPMERESMSHHALWSRGHVMIGGLGMGLLLYNVCRRREVTKVTVVEKIPGVIRLFHKICDPETWVGWEKVEIVQADIFDYTPSEKVDTLLLDIWPSLGDEDLERHTRLVQGRVCADLVLAWGQELAYMSYVVRRKARKATDRALWEGFCKDTEVPWGGLGQDPHYLELCLQAAYQVIHY